MSFASLEERAGPAEVEPRGGTVSADDTPGDTSLVAFVLAAVLLGFLCGICFVEDWKDSIDPAQVIAALVRYPETNPNYLRQVKMFTIVHQVSALLLAGGMTERTLCSVTSGVEGALLFLAVGLPVFALSKRPVLAAGCSFLLVRAFGVTMDGVTYPVMLVGSAANWGVIGLHFVLIAMGLCAAGRTRLAMFCLGLAPAVHPSLGIWLLLAFALVLLAERVGFPVGMPRRPAGLLAGLGFSAAAIGFHFLAYPGYKPLAQLPDGLPYLLAEIRFWDAHRNRFSLVNPGMMLLWSSVALALIAYAIGAGSAARRRYSGFLLAAAALAALGSYGNWYPEQVPSWILIAMPARVFNVVILGGFGLWMGLLASRRDQPSHQGMLLVAAAALLFQRFHFLLPVLTVGAAWALDRLWRWKSPGPWSIRGLELAQTATIVAAACLVCLPHLREISAPPSLGPIDDPAIQALRAGSGMVLTASSISQVQAASRRPVLLRGDELDNFAYTSEAAPAAARILAEIYGVDYFDPPIELRGTGGLARDVGRTLWEQRSPQDWAEIGRRWGISTVVTFKDWSLQLHREATGRDFAVYELNPPPAR
jgi:hypothetical protein